MVKLFIVTICTFGLFLAAKPILGSVIEQNPLHAAAYQNNVEVIEQILSNGTIDIDVRDGRGATALLVATHRNNIEAARALIDAGADVNMKDRINDSAYLYAGARGHLDILKMTLAHGADLQSVNRYGGTALIPAAERGHVETVQQLIDAGVAVDHVNKLGWTALLEAVILGDGGYPYQEIVSILLNAGADPNLADKNGVTALQHAQKRGYREVESILREAGAN